MSIDPVTQGNIYDAIPDEIETELFDLIVDNNAVKIERIVSQGHSSPESGWYDQEQSEWVIVLKGEAIIALDDGSEVHLEAGGHLNIPAHTRHRVAWTKPDIETVWIAVHY